VNQPFSRSPSVSRRAFLTALGYGGLAVGAGWSVTAPGSVHAQTAPSAVPALPNPGVGIGPRLAPAFQAAAARALDGLVARLDPSAGYRPQFVLDLTGDAARLVHDDYWDGVDLGGRTVDALVRLRRMLGGDAGEAESALRSYFLGRQGEQGLFYNDGPEAAQIADTFCQGRALLGLTSWVAATGDAEVETRLQWLIAGLSGIAVSQDDYSYFPGRAYRGRWLDYALMGQEAYDGLDNYGYAAQCALPLLEYYALSGYRPALELAGRVLRHFVAHSGQVTPEGHFAGETHASGYLPLAIAAVRYGIATSDERFVTWAERLYKWVRSQSSDFGWVPGPLGMGTNYFQRWYLAPQRRTCETCSLADALELASLLARVRSPDYWDDVERFARNQLLQNQYGTAEAVLGPRNCAQTPPAVRAALAGAWESFALPYRLLARPDDRRVVEGCCSASGARALGLVWERSVERQDATLSVHLGITRDSPWAQVISYEPAEGRLEVMVREPLVLRLRVPSWAVPDSLTLAVDGVPREPRRGGGYVLVDEVPAGSRVTLGYRLVEREEGFTVNDETTLAYWRGGSVHDVLPDRGPAPIYQPKRLAHPDDGGSTSATACPATGS
jgi:hypothetical protein